MALASCACCMQYMVCVPPRALGCTASVLPPHGLWVPMAPSHEHSPALVLRPSPPAGVMAVMQAYVRLNTSGIHNFRITTTAPPTTYR